MAETLLTSAGVLAANTTEDLLPVIEEVVHDNPELNFFSAAPIDKNSYYSMVIESLPTVGFREPGNDRNYSSPTISTKLHQCYNIDASWELEMARAEQYNRGAAWACASMQRTHLVAAFYKLSQQIWYGDHNSAYGFDGLFKFTNAYGSEKVITCNTSKTFTDGSSVFLLMNSPDYVTINWGHNGQLSSEDLTRQKIGSVGSGRWCYTQRIEGWVGLQNLSKHSAVCIRGLSDTSGNDGLTDSLLSDALYLFPAGRSPAAIFMSRRSLRQLQKSRYSKSYTPTGDYAPIPTEFNGIPIITTDAISDTEDYSSLDGSGSGSGS